MNHPTKLFSKTEIIDMIVNHMVTDINVPESIKNYFYSIYIDMSDSSFIRKMRKSLKLYLCVFGPDKYYFRYN
jgi:hypothetical protein